jgi:predicted Fe-Mo cluster-binding NifX family protein
VLLGHRSGEQVPHHLDEALFGDHVGHPERVVLGQGEEERLLVAEVVEDRAAGQPGGLLEAPDCGAFVAVAREAGTRAVEDLAAAGVEVVLADPWASSNDPSTRSGNPIRTYA